MRGATDYDDKTIPSFLAQIFNQEEPRLPAIMFNFGEPSFNSLMETKYLQKVLIERPPAGSDHFLRRRQRLPPILPKTASLTPITAIAAAGHGGELSSQFFRAAETLECGPVLLLSPKNFMIRLGRA